MLPPLEWIWDQDKDERNRQRHKLPLEAGKLVLSDRLAISRPDPHPDGDRCQTVGTVAGVTLFVVHTEPVPQPDGSELGRIISVRKATSHERRAYEEGDF